jgi:2-dehydro-3-deoxyphosphogluconate aldolase/(4S)-4-hydroxy-2-oxoglutarate aldolase
MSDSDVSVLERIARRRIVPVVVLEQVELAEPLAETLLKAGLDVIEVTFRTSAAA